MANLDDLDALYARLKMRTDRLAEERDINAPQVIIVNELKLISSSCKELLKWYKKNKKNK